MAYTVYLTDEAQKFLDKCDNSISRAIIKRLEYLSINPRAGKPLTANLAGYYSLRIGNYRALYQIKHTELMILVITIGHRKNIYD